MNKCLTLTIYLAIISILMVSCSSKASNPATSQKYAPVGTLTVEQEPSDPKLHGQTIRFTVPMVYMEYNEEDKKEIDEISISIGKFLIDEDSADSLFNRKKTHLITKIPTNVTFTILKSYWVRHDWFTREFAADYQQLVLKDENGNLSVCMRSSLIDSTKPELRKYR